MKIAITGANGHLGLRLIGELCQEHEVLALVRSDSAAQAIQNQYPGAVSCAVVDYTNARSLAGAVKGAETLVHLVGIIKESRDNSFYEAHQATSLALVGMFDQPTDSGQDITHTQEYSEPFALQHIIYLSLLGVDKHSNNQCFASRAEAEDVLKGAPVPVSILRVPMVLGEGDFASGSLAKKAKKKVCFILRGESLEQPIYAGDVIKAITSRLLKRNEPVESLTIELAGPESLTRKQLTLRASSCFGGDPAVISVPQILIILVAWCLERFAENPPVTRAMLGVLDHDDNIDVKPALAQLKISLTSLDETLSKVLRGRDPG